MTNPVNQTPEPDTIEQLLRSLAGIISARAVVDGSGRLEEIHLLAAPGLHPKQIVRNVESALSAGLGIEINRRIVSVAQLREDAVEGEVPAPAAAAPAPSESPLPPAPNGAATPRRPAGIERPIFIGHEVSVDARRNVECRVFFRVGDTEVTGRGEGFDSPQGRAEAAARAVIAALDSYRTTDRVGIEGVAIVEAAGGEYVLVSGRPLRGRRRQMLTGAAPLRDSPEEAAILAALQATNHWRSGG